jgi:hypothetical protein
MIENPGQRIRRIIPVLKLLFTGKAICLNVHINVHYIFHSLLPAIGLRMRNHQAQNTSDEQTMFFHSFNYSGKIRENGSLEKAKIMGREKCAESMNPKQTNPSLFE